MAERSEGESVNVELHHRVNACQTAYTDASNSLIQRYNCPFTVFSALVLHAAYFAQQAHPENTKEAFLHKCAKAWDACESQATIDQKSYQQN